MRQLLFIIFSVLLFVQCSKDNAGTSEGAIKYKITYLDDAKENPIINLLPSNMNLLFKDNSTIAKIEGFMGLFSFAYIVNFDKNINSTMVRIVDVKYSFEGTKDQMAYGYDEMKNMKINVTEETKQIAGYNCKKALVTYDGAIEPIILYFTNDIDIQKPNCNNPFAQIDGVLLEFQVRLNNINMKFEATEVKSVSVSNEEFDIPTDFKKVSRDEIAQFINSYMQDKPVDTDKPKSH